MAYVSGENSAEIIFVSAASRVALLFVLTLGVGVSRQVSCLWFDLNVKIWKHENPSESPHFEIILSECQDICGYLVSLHLVPPPSDLNTTDFIIKISNWERTVMVSNGAGTVVRRESFLSGTKWIWVSLKFLVCDRNEPLWVITGGCSHDATSYPWHMKEIIFWDVWNAARTFVIPALRAWMKPSIAL